jgi:hypothetical protein
MYESLHSAVISSKQGIAACGRFMPMCAHFYENGSRWSPRGTLVLSWLSISIVRGALAEHGGWYQTNFHDLTPSFVQPSEAAACPQVLPA